MSNLLYLRGRQHQTPTPFFSRTWVSPLGPFCHWLDPRAIALRVLWESSAPPSCSGLPAQKLSCLRHSWLSGHRLSCLFLSCRRLASQRGHPSWTPQFLCRPACRHSEDNTIYTPPKSLIRQKTPLIYIYIHTPQVPHQTKTHPYKNTLLWKTAPHIKKNTIS